MDVSRASLKEFVTRIAQTVLSFVALAYFARELGSAELGTFFLFQATLSALGMASNLGVDTAIEKRMSAVGDPGAVLSTAALIKLALLVVLAVAVVGLRGRVNAYVGADVALFLILAHALAQANTVFTQGLRGELRVGEVAEVRLVAATVRYALSGALVYSGLDMWALVYGLIVGFAVGSAWTFWKLETAFETPRREYAWSLYDYAKFNLVPTLGLKIHNWMDVLIIGWFLTPAAVGAYEVSWRVAAITTILAGAISATVIPQTSAWQVEGRTDRIEDLIANAFVPSLFLVIPATFGVLVLAPDVLGLVFGREYAVAWLALIVLVAGKVPGVIQMLVGKCLLGLDHPDLVARATVVSIVANLVLNVVLIQQFGIVGAAVGTTTSLAAGMVIRTYYLRRFLSIRFPAREVGWCVFASVAMTAIVYWITTVIGVESIVELFGVVAVGVASYGAVAVTYRPLRTRLVGYMRSVMPVDSGLTS